MFRSSLKNELYNKINLMIFRLELYSNCRILLSLHRSIEIREVFNWIWVTLWHNIIGLHQLTLSSNAPALTELHLCTNKNYLTLLRELHLLTTERSLSKQLGIYLSLCFPQANNQSSLGCPATHSDSRQYLGRFI